MSPSPVQELIDALVASLADGSFAKLTLSKPRPDEDPLEPGPRQAFVRLVEIRRAPHVSVLFRHPRKDVTRNWPVAEAGPVVADLLATRFLNAHLFTTAADLELRTGKRGDPVLLRHRASHQVAGSRSHDRPKAYVLGSDAPWMRALGLVGPGGHVKSDKADKYRQLQNIVKLVDGQVERAGLRGRERLRVVDMGAGKAYLTFALHDYFRRHLGIEAEVVGADRNAELVATCAGIASDLGLEGLSFVHASVEDVDLSDVDVLVALHACDTATDDALFRGVEAGASLIMAVPCCQKELRPQLRPPEDERPLLKHDTFKDRFAQMLTDGMRGLLLESQGYRTRVIEFISDAHTHRNVMIVAVKDPGEAPREARLAEIRQLADRYGIREQRLLGLLSEAGRLG